jgi:altronate hydrolase
MSTLTFSDVALRLHAEDSVAVARRLLPRESRLDGAKEIVLASDIPPGHKFALRDIDAGAPVIKYGQVIGFARGNIRAGEHIHTQNLELKSFDRDYSFGVDAKAIDYVPEGERRTFMGYARPDGNVGTRNYIAIISSVNCSASVSKYVADRFKAEEIHCLHPNVDGVVAFTHKTGCGIQPDEPLKLLQRVLAGIAHHPNISGYIMIGLGCEVNQVQTLVKEHRLDEPRPGVAKPVFMTIQNSGGIRKTVDAAAAAVRQLLPVCNKLTRTEQPISKLTLALNCGGSDGNSGITANPALGFASDTLVRHGGASVLAETPEIYGAEHLLTRRALTREIGEKLIERVRWWEEHAKLFGATIDNNPSPGNKEGGLTTIYEKSLGAVAKGGQSPLAAVYKYAEPITARGFSFMDTPGYDPVSMTGLVAGGCNVGVFTTGRGSVYGCKPAPCIKVATNTSIYTRMMDDMDINAGTILDGKETVEQVGARIFEKIVSVASGEKTKSEVAGLGDEEFAPWMLGPTF